MVYWELASNKIPYKGHLHETIEKGVIAGRRLPVPSSTPTEFCNIIQKCWAHKPSDRPSSIDLLGMLDEYLRKQGNFNL